MIPLPPPETVLFPRDKVLLMGTSEQVKGGKKFLGAVSGAPTAWSVIEEVSMEALAVPVWSEAAGRTLGDLAPAKRYGVLVAGINRAGVRILNPSADEQLRAGDEVLVLGNAEQIRLFKTWLRERPVEEGSHADPM
jgi:monovalent cation:H+ antiporter-2, CPA2 family